MPKTLMEFKRIKAMHDAGNHDRCHFGCSPDNPDPTLSARYCFDGHTGREIANSITSQLAGVFNRDDPRFAMVDMAVTIARRIPSEDVESDRWAIVGQMLQDALETPDEPSDGIDVIRLRGWQRVVRDLN